MTPELAVILARIVNQCPANMRRPEHKSYFLHDITLSIADIQAIEAELMKQMGINGRK